MGRGCVMLVCLDVALRWCIEIYLRHHHRQISQLINANIQQITQRLRVFQELTHWLYFSGGISHQKQHITMTVHLSYGPQSIGVFGGRVSTERDQSRLSVSSQKNQR